MGLMVISSKVYPPFF